MPAGSTPTRVVKNTAFLYAKMIITMVISLYTTRLILASLGASDFGIFNVVGGAIAMLGFLNSTMANATQRFMSYAEGEGGEVNKRTVFNASLVLHVVVAALTVLLLLAAMWPLFDGVFVIHPDRLHAARVVYYSLIFSTVIGIISAPYDAVMNAHENMLYYSVIGIVEALLKLAIAVACVYANSDKLIVYGLLMASVPLISFAVITTYCHRHYSECVIAPRRYWNRGQMRRMTGFFGWNFLTAVSSLLSAQGIGVVLNHFFGAVLNAAQGVANQVNGTLANFSVNMMKALNPVITKSAGARNQNAMNKATLAGCKFSTLLLMFFGIPLSLEVHYILSIWLKEVPAWTSVFVVMQMTQFVIVQMAASASTAVYASGDIKHYAIWKSVMNASPLLLVWLAFSWGGSPAWLYVPMIVVWAICGDVVIVYYAHKKCGLPLGAYLRSVLLPLICAAAVCLIVGLLPVLLLPPSLLRLALTCLATTTGMLLSARLFLLTSEEKTILRSIAHRLISRKRK